MAGLKMGMMSQLSMKEKGIMSCMEKSLILWEKVPYVYRVRRVFKAIRV